MRSSIIAPRHNHCEQHKLVLSDKMRQFEYQLGDVHDHGNPFSWQHSLKLDEQECFPQQAADELNKLEFDHYFIPKHYGGKLDSLLDTFNLVRLIARRDLTLAIGYGKTFLGGTPVWVGNNEHLKWQVANIIKQHYPLSLALTEQQHGSDLLASDCQLSNSQNLSGQKWLINNANRSRGLSILVRHENIKGPRALSMVFVDKQMLTANQYQELSKIRTHGIRGADISGITFNNVPITQDQFICDKGLGFENILKSLQITRTMCASLSFGALDSALRLTVNYTLKRKLYERKLIDISHIKNTLVNSLLSTYIIESLTWTVCRIAHLRPQQLSIYAAVLKYFCPHEVDNVIENLATVMGSRFYYTEGEYATLSKIWRDHSLVGLFDGSSVVNLQSIAQQLPMIARKLSKNIETIINFEAIFHLQHELPELNFENLALSHHGNDFLLQYLLNIIKQPSQQIALNRNTFHKLGIMLQQFIQDIGLLNRHLAKLTSHEYQLAERYCYFITIASVIGFWQYNHSIFSREVFFEETLNDMINKLLHKIDSAEFILPPESANRYCQNLIRYHEDNKLFSQLDCDLN